MSNVTHGISYQVNLLASQRSGHFIRCLFIFCFLCPGLLQKPKEKEAEPAAE